MTRPNVIVVAVSLGAVALTAGVVALVETAHDDSPRVPSSLVAEMVRVEGGATEACAGWRDFVRLTGSEDGAVVAMRSIARTYGDLTGYTPEQIDAYVDWMTDNC